MSPDQKKHSLHILLISIHGLIRGQDLELGCDADTGGQTKYVVELARALARHPDVEKVDLVTRRILDERVAADYGKPVEVLEAGARIVRIEAGPPEYLPKEELWPHLDSFSDHLFDWMRQQPRLPDVIHTHYADAGYVGVRLSQLTGLPLIHTGHSLGRDKCRRLVALGLTMEEIDARYNMEQRISAEEEVLSTAELVITSTRNEIEDQYELYDCYTPDRMAVVPPGTDLEQFHPPDPGEENIPYARVLERHLRHPEKPIILALSRPDQDGIANGQLSDRHALLMHLAPGAGPALVRAAAGQGLSQVFLAVDARAQHRRLSRRQLHQ